MKIYSLQVRVSKFSPKPFARGEYLIGVQSSRIWPNSQTLDWLERPATYKRSNFLFICKLRYCVNRNLELERVYPSNPFLPVQMLAAKAGVYIRREHLEGAFGSAPALFTNQGILKGEVSLYHWPPVWQVWNPLYDYSQFLFLFAKQTNPNQSNRRSTVQWYFPL